MCPMDDEEWAYQSIEDTAPVDGPFPLPKPKETEEEKQKRLWALVVQASQN